MADIRLIATDMDGTFLMNETDPHPDNIEAVKECQRRGIIVCGCTGRCWGSARGVVSRGGLDSLCATNNGASIVDARTGEYRYRCRFDPSHVEAILRYGIDAGAETTATGHSTIYCYGPYADNMRQLYKRIQHWPYGDRADMVFCVSLEEMVDLCAQDAEMIHFSLDIHADIDGVWDALAGITDVEITSSVRGSMEVSPKGGTKQTAVSVLADIYDIDPEQVMAIGDNFNDMSMLMWAGVGVAMGNADDRLKSMANFVTTRNYEGGFAHAVHTLVLND